MPRLHHANYGVSVLLLLLLETTDSDCREVEYVIVLHSITFVLCRLSSLTSSQGRPGPAGGVADLAGIRTRISPPRGAPSGLVFRVSPHLGAAGGWIGWVATDLIFPPNEKPSRMIRSKKQWQATGCRAQHDWGWNRTWYGEL